jgi:hypothetical protein
MEADAVTGVFDHANKRAPKGLYTDEIESAARNELRRVSHLFDDPAILAKCAFIRFSRNRHCTTVQAFSIVCKVLSDEGFSINDEVLQRICDNVAGTFKQAQ